MWRVFIQQHPKAGPLYAKLDRSPGWVLRAAIFSAVIVVVVPLLLLFAAALLVGILVFVTLSLILTVVMVFRNLWFSLISGGWGRPGGRRNVRVIRRV